MTSSGAEVKLSIKALKVTQKKSANKYNVRVAQVYVGTLQITVQTAAISSNIGRVLQVRLHRTFLFISNEWVSKKTGKEKCYFNQN